MFLGERKKGRESKPKSWLPPKSLCCSLYMTLPSVSIFRYVKWWWQVSFKVFCRACPGNGNLRSTRGTWQLLMKAIAWKSHISRPLGAVSQGSQKPREVHSSVLTCTFLRMKTSSTACFVEAVAQRQMLKETTASSSSGECRNSRACCKQRGV